MIEANDATLFGGQYLKRLGNLSRQLFGCKPQSILDVVQDLQKLFGPIAPRHASFAHASFAYWLYFDHHFRAGAHAILPPGSAQDA
jgi:hypothetical protein